MCTSFFFFYFVVLALSLSSHSSISQKKKTIFKQKTFFSIAFHNSFFTVFCLFWHTHTHTHEVIVSRFFARCCCCLFADMYLINLYIYVWDFFRLTFVRHYLLFFCCCPFCLFGRLVWVFWHLYYINAISAMK